MGAGSRNAVRAGVGGESWFACVERTSTVAVAVARSVERTGFYLRAGSLL